MELEQYQPLETSLTVSRADIGIIARVDDTGKPVQAYEILLAKKDSIVVRVKGAHRSSMPKKIDLPIQWDPTGHEVDGVKYQFLKNPGVEIGPKSGKIKKLGKRAEGPSKLDVCREIWKTNPNVTRQDMIGKFVSDGKCTPAGANTYYLKIKGENA